MSKAAVTLAEIKAAASGRTRVMFFPVTAVSSSQQNHLRPAARWRSPSKAPVYSTGCRTSFFMELHYYLTTDELWLDLGGWWTFSQVNVVTSSNYKKSTSGKQLIVFIDNDEITFPSEN